jgi:hypothetical protein
MEKILKHRKLACLLVICIIMQLYSCQSGINFKLIKPGVKIGTTKNPTSIEKVKSYSLRYNPKANGMITMTLADESGYEADKLDASQISSLIVLLNSKGLQFDTKNEEFTLEGGNNE